MDLSIILVNFNTCNDTMNCIESIYNETTNIKFEIIVVDNESTDSSKQMILSKYNDIIWIDAGYNSGFARANNLGLRVVKGQYALLLNTDTIVLNKAIELCYSSMIKNETIVAAGIQLLNKDNTSQFSGSKFVKGGLNTLLPLPYIGDTIRSLGYSLKYKKPGIETVEKTVEVDWIVGAFVMFRRTVLEHNEYLDEDFFMYSEEMEWCFRLKKYGKLVLFNEPKIYHLGGGSSKEFYNTKDSFNGKNLWDKKGKQILLSNFVRIRKQFGLLWFMFHYMVYLIEIPVFATLLIINHLIKKNQKYTFQNLRGYINNVMTLMPYIPKIVYNKPYFYKL